MPKFTTKDLLIIMTMIAVSIVLLYNGYYYDRIWAPDPYFKPIFGDTPYLLCPFFCWGCGVALLLGGLVAPFKPAISKLAIGFTLTIVVLILLLSFMFAA